MNQNPQTIFGSRERGEKLSELFDALNKKRSKLERQKHFRELSENEKIELEAIISKLSTFNEKCRQFIKKRKNGYGKFMVDEYVRWCSNLKNDDLFNDKGNNFMGGGLKNERENPILGNYLNNFDRNDNFKNNAFVNYNEKNRINNNVVNATMRRNFMDGDTFHRNLINSSVVISAKMNYNKIRSDDIDSQQLKMIQNREIVNLFLKPESGFVPKNAQFEKNSKQNDQSNKFEDKNNLNYKIINRQDFLNENFDSSLERIEPLQKSNVDTRNKKILSTNINTPLLPVQAPITTAARRTNYDSNNKNNFNTISNTISSFNEFNYNMNYNKMGPRFKSLEKQTFTDLHPSNINNDVFENKFLFTDKRGNSKTKLAANRIYIGEDFDNNRSKNFDLGKQNRNIEDVFKKGISISQLNSEYNSTSLKPKINSSHTSAKINNFIHSQNDSILIKGAFDSVISANFSKTSISTNENSRIFIANSSSIKNINESVQDHVNYLQEDKYLKLTNPILNNDVIFDAILCHLDVVLHKTLHMAQNFVSNRESKTMLKDDIALALKSNVTDIIDEKVINLNDNCNKFNRDYSKHKKLLKVIDKLKELDDL